MSFVITKTEIWLDVSIEYEAPVIRGGDINDDYQIDIERRWDEESLGYGEGDYIEFDLVEGNWGAEAVLNIHTDNGQLGVCAVLPTFWSHVIPVAEKFRAGLLVNRVAIENT